MKKVMQQDLSGCAVACVASVLGVSYKKALNSFELGKERAKFRGFFCKEIICALESNNLKYSFKYVTKRVLCDCPIGAIVYLQKDSTRPSGHYVLKTKKGWMDPWLNFPKLKAKAGFRKLLPGKPSYAIIPQNSLSS